MRDQFAETFLDNCNSSIYYSNAQGYFTRLCWLNNYIDIVNARMNEDYLSLNGAISKLTFYEAQLDSSITELQSLEYKLESEYSLRYVSEPAGNGGTRTGYRKTGENGYVVPWSSMTVDQQNEETKWLTSTLKSDSIKSTLVSWGEFSIAKNEAEKGVAEYEVTVKNLETKQKKDAMLIEGYVALKNKLHLAFQKLFGSYIQEGTW